MWNCLFGILVLVVLLVAVLILLILVAVLILVLILILVLVAVLVVLITVFHFEVPPKSIVNRLFAVSRESSLPRFSTFILWLKQQRSQIAEEYRCCDSSGTGLDTANQSA